MEFFDPKVDSAFKKLFGSEDHTRVTISLVHTIKDRSRLRDGKEERFIDIFCTDEEGRNVIIEIEKNTLHEVCDAFSFMNNLESERLWKEYAKEESVRLSEEKGRAEGRIKTREEIARGMIGGGLSSKLIAKLTDLSEAEIEALR